MCTLELTESGKNSRMLRHLTPEFVKHLQKKKCTLNNHKLGLTPLKFKKHKALEGFFKIVSIPEFLFGTRWEPLLEPKSFGVLPLLFGTLMIVIGAAIVCIPIGLTTAIYLSQSASKKMRRII